MKEVQVLVRPRPRTSRALLTGQRSFFPIRVSIGSTSFTVERGPLFFQVVVYAPSSTTHSQRFLCEERVLGSDPYLRHDE